MKHSLTKEVYSLAIKIRADQWSLTDVKACVCQKALSNCQMVTMTATT